MTVVGIILVLLLMPLPSARLSPWPALLEAIENLGHPLVFAVLAATMLRLLRSRMREPMWRPWILSLVACITLGAIIEWVQSLVGRDGTWSDVWGDAVGCLAALCSETAITRHKAGEPYNRVLPPGSAAAIFMLLAVGPFLVTAAAYVRRADVAPVFWRSDSQLLQQFSSFQEGEYSGLIVEEPPRDWRGYRYLVIDVDNEGSSSRSLQLRVHDAAHDNSYADRYHATLLVPPGRSVQRVALAEVRTTLRNRLMQMQAIRGVAVFVRKPETMRAIHIKQLALEP